MGQDITEYGIWKAEGADRNFDFAGPRSVPYLGLFEGEYGKVLDHVRKNKNWAVYKNEGTLTKVSIAKIK